MTIDLPHGSGARAMSRRQMIQLSALSLGVIGLAACGSSDDANAGAGSNERGRSQSEAAQLGFHEDAVIVGSLAKPVVDFIDVNNAPYDFVADTEGRLTLLFFGYTSCPNECPVYLNNVSEALKRIDGPAGKAKVVFVGVDTARDTPEKMKTYLASRNVDFVGVTASPEAIDDALASLLLPAVVIPEDTSGNYAVGHPASAMVFTPDNLCHIMYPFDIRQSEWAEELKKLVDFDWSTAPI